MQRVLSFPPPSRGFGDPSEFVSKRMCFSFMFSLGFIAFLGGFLLGRFVFDQELELSRNKLKRAHLHHQQVFGAYKNYSEYNVSNVLDVLSESSIREYMTLLKNFSSSDSVVQAMREAQILHDHLSKNGFDLVSPLVESQTHLSYPALGYSNQAFILESENMIVHQFNDTRQTQCGEPNEIPVSTTVEGTVVYVNFGRNEDYQFLDSVGISVTGNIVLVRAGGVAPMEMVTNALDHEAVGILAYLDPEQNGLNRPLISPSDLAKLQILHGNQIDKWRGRISLLEISSSDAEKILRYMSATQPTSENWKGKLKSSYPIGPGFLNPNWKMRMEVHTVNVVKTYSDVLGAMKGSQEPDRFVMLASDKSTEQDQSEAISILMEIVRVLGHLKKDGWRPHRSIVIAFWGLEGPNQYLVSHPDTLWSDLITKTVGYLKVDSSYELEKDRTHSIASPVMEKLFLKSVQTASLKDPSIDFMVPFVNDNLFSQYGIPFLTVNSFKVLSNETLRKVATFWAVIVWDVAESHGLPFGLDSYTNFFTHSVAVLEKRFKLIAQKHTLFLDTLVKTVQELIETIKLFEGKWSHADMSKSIEMRIMNDQLLGFVHSINCNRDQVPLANAFSSGHLIFSKSVTGTDEKAGFGVLQDLLLEITSTRNPENLHHQIISHLASLVECINLAKYTLTESLDTFITWKT